VICVLPLALGAACGTNPAVDAKSARMPAGISYRERVESYRVTGADTATIGQGLRAAPAKNGQHFAGYFEWQLAWRFQSQAEGSFCRITQATITITSVVTMPEWAAPAGVDKALVEEWQRYSSALATHEAGHRDVVIGGATRLQKALLSAWPQDCASMQQTAQQIAQPLIAGMRVDSDRYDETTHHGATQGAIWAGATQPWWLSQ